MTQQSLTLAFLGNSNGLTTYTDYIDQVRSAIDSDPTRKEGNRGSFVKGEFTPAALETVLSSNSAEKLRKLQIVGTVARFAPDLLETPSIQTKAVSLVSNAWQDNSAMCKAWCLAIRERLEKQPNAANTAALIRNAMA